MSILSALCTSTIIVWVSLIFTCYLVTINKSIYTMCECEIFMEKIFCKWENQLKIFLVEESKVVSKIWNTKSIFLGATKLSFLKISRSYKVNLFWGIKSIFSGATKPNFWSFWGATKVNLFWGTKAIFLGATMTI